MVAIMTGAGLGLERGSAMVLGSRGQLGNSALGRFGENVTVNAATGNLMINRTDEILIGLGPDNVLARAYNSLGAANDDNGDNWQLSAQRRIGAVTGTINQSGSTVVRIDWDGSDTLYSWDAGRSAYVSKQGSGAYDELKFAANIWTWTDGNSRVVDKYDHANGGRILSSEDTDAAAAAGGLNKLNFQYDGSGRLSVIAYASGEHVDISWVGNNIQQIQTTHSSGTLLTRVRYGYDTSNRLATVTTDLTPADNVIADSNTVVINYTYDGTSKRVALITQTGGSALAILYDGSFRVSKLTETSASGITRVTDFTYGTDPENAAVKMTTIKDAHDQLTKLYSDASGQLIRIDQPPAQAGMAMQTLRFSYNANGDVLSVVDGTGYAVDYAYDANGNVIQQRDATGSTIDRVYGTSNELQIETRYAVADPDGSGSGLPSDPLYTRYAYDSELHLRYIVNAEGEVTEYTYDAEGRQTAQIIYRAQVYGTGSTVISTTALDTWRNAIADKSTVSRTDNSYDFRGNLQSVKQFSAANASGVGLTTQPYTQTNYVYDQYGNLLSRQTVGQNAETYVYDGMGRVLTANELNGTSTITYTDTQNKSAVTLANGLVRTSTYNYAGELVSYAESGTGYTTTTATYKYDKMGRLRSVTDASSRTSYYLYDALGRKIADVSALGSLTEYRYNRSDSLSSTTRYATLLSGAQVASLVDGSGNPANVTLAAIRPAANAADVWNFRIYDKAQRLIQAIDGTGATTVYTYDGAGRLVTTTSYVNKLATTEMDRLRQAESGYNFWLNGNNASLWAQQYLTVTSAGTIDGAPAFKLAISQAGAFGTTLTNNISILAGDSFTYSISVMGVGTTTSSILGLYGNVTHPYGGDGGTFNYSLSGPGSVASSATLPLWTVTGLSTTQATRFTFSRTHTVAELAHPYLFVESWVAANLAVGDALIVANPVLTMTIGHTLRLPTAHANDVVSRNFYDAEDRLIGTLDGRGYLTQNIYNDGGEKIESAAFANYTTPSLRATGTFAQLLSSVGTNTRDIRTRYAYDGRGLLRFELDPNLRPTEYVYDAVGQLIRTIEYGTTVASTGSYTLAYLEGQVALTAIQNHADNRITRFTYNSLGQLAYTIDAAGYVSRFDYDGIGQAIRELRFFNPHATSGDRTLAQMQSWATTNASGSDRLTRTYYDIFGHLTFTVDPEGYVTEYVYDAAGRKTAELRYAAQYTINDTHTALQVDALVSPAASTAVQLSFTYDNDGRLVNSYDGLGVRTYRIYDAVGRLSEIHEAYGTADVSVTRYTYDIVDRVASETRGYGASEASTTSFTYDAFGNVLTRTDGRGFITSYSYDARGWVLTTTVPLDASTNAVTYTDYDAFGNLIRIQDPRGNLTFRTYDKLNRLIWEVDPESYATYTTYSIGDEISSVTRYAVKVTGAAPAIVPTITAAPGDDATTLFTRDLLGRVTKVIDAQTDAQGNAVYEQYTLNAFGDRTAVRNRLGGTTNNLFDKRGLLIQETLPVGSIRSDGTTQSANIVNKFSYDARGNRTQMIEAFGLTEQRTTNYVYDKCNQLTQTKGDAIQAVGQDAKFLAGTTVPTQNFVYDKRGNLIGSSDPTGALTLSYYDDLDRKVAEVSPVGTLSTWTYDANGNVTAARIYGDALTSSALFPTDPTSMVAMVYRLYDVATGRMPYASEVDSWLYRLINIHSNYVQPAAEGWPAIDPFGEKMNAFEAICAEILTDAGVQTRLGAADNATFISQLYNCAFRRAPTSQETSIWLANMAACWTRGGMLAVFTEHVDHRQIAAPLIAQAVAGGAAPAPLNASNYRETLFFYDRNDRLIETRIQNVRTGYFNGTSYQSQVQTISAFTEYDAGGNIIKETDARGSVTFSYYDKNGRRIAQADTLKYLTVWTYDSDGNAVAGTRYANQMNITPTTGTTLAQLLASVGTQSKDRTTTFTYDRNGRRLTEARTGLVAWTVNASNGQISQAATTAMITYSYNGLGEVTSKIANGEQTDWTYDAIGRQTSKAGPAFFDYLGVTAQNPDGYDRLTVRNYYDGLNNVTRSTSADLTDAVPSARVTTYSYGAGGRLFLVTNADGFSTEHYYDAAGRLISQAYARMTSSGSTVSDVQSYRYDAAGRLTSKTDGRWNGSGWIFSGFVNQMKYNAYGEMIAQGLNGYQETFDYDGTGRLWRSNAGDGVLKFYAYDQNGNQTLAVISTGADLSGWTITSAITAANQATTGVAATITTFDARNQYLRIREAFRDQGYGASTIVRGKDYNAFGEVVTEIDGRNNSTIFDYNTMGRLIWKQMPTVSVTAENGAQSNVAPFEQYYYDLSGRLVAVRDGNGNLTTRVLLAGSGFDGEDAKVLKEFHADGGVLETKYDVFGDARVLINEIGNVETRSYDAMGRVITLGRPQRSDGTSLTEYYAYDGLGRRIQHWNHQLTSAVKELTDYDVQGRVITQVDYGGDTTSYAYSWNPNATTSGLGVGGVTKTTTKAGAPAAAWEITDYWGHVIDSQDHGGRNYDYAYNKGGKLVTRTNNVGENLGYTYFNSGRLATVSSSVTFGVASTNYGRSTTTSYRYDVDGNRTYEELWVNLSDPFILADHGLGAGSYNMRDQNSAMSYDALNRMISYSDNGENGAAPVSIAYEYDAVGNVRRMNASYLQVGFGTNLTQDYWYKYDNMNRFVTTKGEFVGSRGSGLIRRGLSGTDITYNAASQRVTAARTIQVEDPGWPDFIPPFTTWHERKELYSYSADGYLQQLNVAQGATVSSMDGMTHVNAPAATGSGTRSAAYARDAMGRVTDYYEYLSDGGTVNYRRQASYDAKSQVTTDHTEQRRSNGTYLTADTVYHYTLNTNGSLWNPTTSQRVAFGTGGAYQGGVVTHTRTTRNDGTVSETANFYEWRDDARKVHSDLFNDATNPGHWSDLAYDSSGYLTTIQFDAGAAGRTDFVNDLDGRVLGSWHKIPTDTRFVYNFHYYGNGVHIGAMGNDGAPESDYVTALGQRGVQSGALFQTTGNVAVAYADFDMSYEPVNPASQGGTASRYTVVEGDTLSSIALQVWGDASFWYLIADANGVFARDRRERHNHVDGSRTWRRS